MKRKTIGQVGLSADPKRRLRNFALEALGI
jgi:hypothetical protein